MLLRRTATAAAAAAAALLLAAPAALAAGGTVVVTPDDLQGWVVNPDPANATAAEFAIGDATSGIGSLRFGPIGDSPAEKFIAQRRVTIPLDGSEAISYDVVGAAPADSDQFYLNVYVDLGDDGRSGDRFYDCRYDYVLAEGEDTVSVNAGTTPSAVAASDGVTCGPTLGTVADSSIFLIALNGGDTKAGDAGLTGAVDTVAVTAAGATTTYDFEPTRDACKDGGWRESTRTDGSAFRNQGDCVQYVETGR